jgi:hypothetical protein
MAVAAMAVPMTDLVAALMMPAIVMPGEGRRRRDAEPGDCDGGDCGKLEDFHVLLSHAG